MRAIPSFTNTRNHACLSGPGTSALRHHPAMGRWGGQPRLFCGVAPEPDDTRRWSPGQPPASAAVSQSVFGTDCATGVAAEEVFAGLTTLYKVTALVRCLRHLFLATCRQAEQTHSHLSRPQTRSLSHEIRMPSFPCSDSYLEDSQPPSDGVVWRATLPLLGVTD